MLTEFEHHLAAHGLSGPTIREVAGMAMQRTLRRNELILSAGDICRHKVFICTGLLRSFQITEDGNEHILQFSPEHTWTLDVESYDRQVPCSVNIAAVEPSRILLWHKGDFDAMLAGMPELKVFSEKLISRNIYYTRARILKMLSASPEEKYADFISTFPDYPSRLPLRMIAAYLGISIKTLTRIRHAQLHR